VSQQVVKLESEDVYTVGDYSVTYSEIENFIKDQGSLVGELFGSLSVAGKGDVVMSSASLALDIFGRVSKITSASTFDGTKYLLAVLPAELAKCELLRSYLMFFNYKLNDFW
jgi:hypothetical protein